MHKTYTVDEARRKLEQYCAYQERCHEEVLQKLKNLNMIPQASDIIITHLIEHNFLNEERFAKSFARGKHRIKHWGKERIIKELKFRNISRYNIDLALKELPEQEYLDHFYNLAQKQWENITETNLQKKKKKLFDFLMRKGYETNLIYNIINDFTK